MCISLRAGMRLAICKKWLHEKGTDTRKKKNKYLLRKAFFPGRY
jgi:hypothetical protein